MIPFSGKGWRSIKKGVNIVSVEVRSWRGCYFEGILFRELEFMYIHAHIAALLTNHML